MKIPTIDKELLFEKVGYVPHEHQKPYHASEARFTIPCCGRRFGKSIMVGHDITWRMFAPDSYIWIIGPTYKLGEKEFRVVYDDIVRKLRVPGVRKSYNTKQGDMRIEMPWNTILEVVSAEKQDSLVGEGLDFACMSEAALHQMSTWQQYIQPALSDKRGGATFPSTPRGFNWYKGLYQMGASNNQFPDYESWRFPTWFNTKMYPLGLKDPELIQIKASVTEHYWQQEYGADFTSREGRIYKDWNDDVHVMHDYRYNPLWKNWLAVDFGFSAPTAIYDIQVDAEDNVYVWREYQVRYLTTWEHGHAILNRENPPGYHITCVAADPRGADGIATLELLWSSPIMHTPVGWEAGVEAVSRWLKVNPVTNKPKMFISDQCPELIRQMNELQTPKQIEGKNDREGQKDYDDHGPDAIRYFFNEWEVLGNGASLEDVYGGSGGYNGSEAHGFFTSHAELKLNQPIGYGRDQRVGY